MFHILVKTSNFTFTAYGIFGHENMDHAFLFCLITTFKRDNITNTYNIAVKFKETAVTLLLTN